MGVGDELVPPFRFCAVSAETSPPYEGVKKIGLNPHAVNRINCPCSREFIFCQRSDECAPGRFRVFEYFDPIDAGTVGNGASVRGCEIVALSTKES